MLRTAVEGAAVSTTDNVGVPVAAIGVSVSPVTTAVATGESVGSVVSTVVVTGDAVSTAGTAAEMGVSVPGTEMVGVPVPTIGCVVSTRIVVGTVGPGVSTLGTIGADGAEVAATGASVVGPFGTIANVGADVTGASVTATPSGVITGDNDGSTEFEGICDAQKRWSLWFP